MSLIFTAADVDADDAVTDSPSSLNLHYSGEACVECDRHRGQPCASSRKYHLV